MKLYKLLEITMCRSIIAHASWQTPMYSLSELTFHKTFILIKIDKCSNVTICNIPMTYYHMSMERRPDLGTERQRIQPLINCGVFTTFPICYLNSTHIVVIKASPQFTKQ